MSSKKTFIFFSFYVCFLSEFCVLLQHTMQYLWQHIRTLIGTYDGSVPFAHFLRNYCKKYPALGSRDRRMLSTILYSWFRCVKGIVLPETGTHDLEHKVMACLKVCQVPMEGYMRLFACVPAPAKEPVFDADLLFVPELALSEGIDRAAWLQSMTVQPLLFIRVVSDREKIKSLLAEKQVVYTEISDTCIAIPNGTPVDTYLPEGSYAVQDASSQYTGSFFEPVADERWYDSCCGAGGKSLLLMSRKVKVQLTVTDKRASIISNLKERFRLYRYAEPAAYVADAADAAGLSQTLSKQQFDNIICDVPCSGSGTWARTPEQLFFFKEQTQRSFPVLQQQIAVNVSRHLKQGGRLFYITCSVFREENEAVVAEIVKQTGLKVVRMQLINGIAARADSMFMAILQ